MSRLLEEAVLGLVSLAMVVYIRSAKMKDGSPHSAFWTAGFALVAVGFLGMALRRVLLLYFGRRAGALLIAVMGIGIGGAICLLMALWESIRFVPGPRKDRNGTEDGDSE